MMEVPQDHLSRIAGSDEHHSAGSLCLCAVASQQKDKPIGEPDAQDQDELGQYSEDIIGYGHSLNEYRNADHMDCRRDDRCHDDPDQFPEAGKPPQTVVQAQAIKYRQTEYDVKWDKLIKRIQIRRLYLGKCTVEPDPECQEIGTPDGNGIVYDKKQGNIMPVFQFKRFLLSGTHPSQRTPISIYNQRDDQRNAVGGNFSFDHRIIHRVDVFHNKKMVSPDNGKNERTKRFLSMVYYS